MYNSLQPGDYVLIEFGHNDQKEKSAGSGAWYNFSYNLKKFIDEVRKKGGNIQWNGINVSAGKLSENWNREAGEQVSLYTYTNGDEVELFLNGKSLGVKKNSNNPKLRARIKWDNIAYAPGTLVAVAKKNGKVVARHQIETTGEAVALKLVVILRAGDKPGKIELLVAGEKMKAKKLVLNTK